MTVPSIMDYHLHTAVTIDGRMDEFSACVKAMSMGIWEIAFTNHVMLNQPDYKISPTDFCTHWENIQACRMRFPEMHIRLGLEMDYYLDREEEIARSIEGYEQLIGRKFDLVLGSVHEIKGGFFSSKSNAQAFLQSDELASLYEDYFDLATRAARSRLFDVLAHPDLIKKYTNEITAPLVFPAYRPAAERLVEALVASGVGIELNTKGLKLPVGEAYPSDELLELYLSESRRQGCRPIITIGSDAHRVEDIGYRVCEAANRLYNLGVASLTIFESREKVPMAMHHRQIAMELAE